MSLRSITQTKQSPSFNPVPTGLLQRKCTSCGQHTIAGAECTNCQPKSGLQRKLTIGASNDPLELEADRIADRVLAAPSNPTISTAPPSIQRFTGQMTEQADVAPASVDRVLSSPGRPLETSLQQDMGQRFGHDFSRVRVHTGDEAARSAQEVDAHAYTVGHNVVFSAGQYAPETTSGKKLLAHELTHVVQQNGAALKPQTKLSIGATNDPAEREAIQAESFTGLQPSIAAKSGAVLARAPKSPPAIGSKFVPPPGATSKFKNVHAEFDGQDFIVYDGTTIIMTQASQSGKPISVRSSDATACGGSTADAYTNNPLYVGIQDFGAIPEGDFTVSLSEFSTFSAWEQAQMITGGMFTDPFGQALHGGDWGSGRAPLHPKTILPGKTGCGDTSKRSGFYLHGGSLPGSSGCIDIDNSGIGTFLSTLGEYKSVIPVQVKYKHAAPTVGTAKRGIGRFTYPTKDGKPIKDPSIWDRLKAIGGGDDAAPPEQKLPTKPEQPKPTKKPKSKTKPKQKQKGSGKKTGSLRHRNKEIFAGYDLDDEDAIDLILDDDWEKEDAIA